ncbi:hypothetical protein JANAI62_20330 [Jannaschia pagri]|uniref:Zinc protease n=1 Tax=Jannaschia pagri TaxID=2829797 RepID=A0ABQ4NLX0_9RHOB|nr:MULTISPECIES: hypothetical protein [unclassified Jannaschia]GIT91576.1 hypothetical protein JANAI61_20340 [Jannaschia sp. AI_61]GIT95410.1 hypothetical protein JANAI62_20330 [Jannaschia sp. AI_62]
MKHRRWTLVSLAIAMVLAAVFLAKAIEGPPAPTALAVHVVTDHGVDQVTAHLILPRDPRTGPRKPGLAHYLEHLVWLGLRPASDAGPDRQSNAWTNRYAVGYWLSGPPDALPDLLARLVGVFDPLAPPPAVADQERGIVLREYEARQVGRLRNRINHQMSDFLYQGAPLADSIIGTPDQIAAFDLAQARALHALTHRPDKGRLVVTGPISERRVHAGLAAIPLLAHATDGPPGRPGLPPLQADRLHLSAGEDTTVPTLIWRKVVALPEPMGFDLLEARSALLSDILDSGLPGGLAGPLRFDEDLARSFHIAVFPLDTTHVEISLSAHPSGDVTLRDLERAVRTTLDDIARRGIPADTHDRLRARFEGFWPDWTDPDDTAAWMAAYTVDRLAVLRDPLPQDALRYLDAQLTRDGTNALLTALAGPGREAVAHLSPNGASL